MWSATWFRVYLNDLGGKFHVICRASAGVRVQPLVVAAARDLENTAPSCNWDVRPLRVNQLVHCLASSRRRCVRGDAPLPVLSAANAQLRPTSERELRERELRLCADIDDEQLGEGFSLALTPTQSTIKPPGPSSSFLLGTEG